MRYESCQRAQSSSSVHAYQPATKRARVVEPKLEALHFRITARLQDAAVNIVALVFVSRRESQQLRRAKVNISCVQLEGIAARVGCHHGFEVASVQ